MSRLFIVFASPSDDALSIDQAVVWVSDDALDRARQALADLRATIPTIDEIVLREERGSVSCRFGTLDIESLAEADEEAAEELQADHWTEIADPDAPVDALLEETEEDFGSVRVHVQDDCFYVTAGFDDGDRSAESERVPLPLSRPHTVPSPPP